MKKSNREDFIIRFCVAILGGKIAQAIPDVVFGEMTKKERKILEFRYGLNGKSHTLEETGQKFGFTREYIRHFELKALNKIRKYIFDEWIRKEGFRDNIEKFFEEEKELLREEGSLGLPKPFHLL